MRASERVVNIEWGPTRFADGLLVPGGAGALLHQRRSGGYGGGVDHALHRLGLLALPEDRAHRVHDCFRRALVLTSPQHTVQSSESANYEPNLKYLVLGIR